MSNISVRVSVNNQIVSDSTYTPSQISSPSYTGSNYIPPYTSSNDQTPLNTGSTEGGISSSTGLALAQVLLELVAAIAPSTAGAVSQVEQALGISSSSLGGTGGTGGDGTGGIGTSSNTGSDGTSIYTSTNSGVGVSTNIGGSLSSGSLVGGSYNTGAGDDSSSLAANKAAVLAACKAQGLSQQQTDVIMSIGAIETNDMNPDERDASKDGTSSENYSAFNLNKGMLEAMGYNPDNGPNLNDPANVGDAVHLMSEAMDKFGVNGFLAWQRGGQAGYQSGAYDVSGYENAVSTGVSEIQQNSSLLTNNDRISTPDIPYE